MCTGMRRGAWARLRALRALLLLLQLLLRLRRHDMTGAMGECISLLFAG